MFKVGQKVRVKQWLDMPQDLQLKWGILTRCIGEVLTITATGESYEDIPLYELQDSPVWDWGLIVLEPEIEPVIRLGEQLLLFEL